jgi:hypothetical protein
MLLFRWVVAIGVALLVLVLLRVLVRFWGLGPMPEAQPVVLIDAPIDEELPDVPKLPSGDLLDAARASLAAGDLGRAVLMARAAALRFLGDHGRLTLHRARTDREYARAVRAHPEHRDLKEVLRATEQHRWGGHPVGLDTARGALDAAERILKPVLVLLCLAAADPAWAQDDRHGPNGDAALFDVLKDYGHSVAWRSAALVDLDDSIDVLVLDTTWVSVEADEWDAVTAWVEAGGVLWVAGEAPFEDLGTRVFLDPAMPVQGTEELAEWSVPSPRWPDGVRHAFEGALGVYWVQTTPASGPWAEGDGVAGLPVVLSIDVGHGAVVAVSDARLLWNGSFVWSDNGQFMGELVHVGQAALGWPVAVPARIELATSATPDKPPPPQAVMNAQLLPFLLQLMALWLLVGLWRGMPFAPLRDPAVEGRLDFVAHVRALGTRWLRLGASRYALAAYGGLWLQRLGVPGLRVAAAKAGHTPERAQALIEALEDARLTPNGPSDPSDLVWMEELWTITRTR